MSTHNITEADIAAIRINDRKPRVARVYHDISEVRQALAQEHYVQSVADLAEARAALNTTIYDILGATRRDVKLPHAHLILMDGRGVGITRWEADMREHVKAGPSPAQRSFHVGIAEDIQRGVIAAWERQQ